MSEILKGRGGGDEGEGGEGEERKKEVNEVLDRALLLISFSAGIRTLISFSK